ncbi:uncharacterized protein [Pocillopora verrucosa]|uniref:uncharacterized protein n=1 Tax=Pocillopora verrucosa TaxID=203993 RepID=UPI00333F7B7C
MAFPFPFPTYQQRNHNNREPGWFAFFHELWRQMALAYQQEVGYWVHKGTVKIASVLLRHFKPENIALEVDRDKVTLHGKHHSEREDGFNTCEFKRVFPLPQNVDPTTVTSRITQDGGVLVIEGLKRVEEKEDDGKFETKLDVSGFKPEEIKIQLHGKELIVCGKRTLEDGGANRSRGFSHRVLLPEDVVVSSVRSRLSKEGLLMVEASRDPALLPRESRSG